MEGEGRFTTNKADRVGLATPERGERRARGDLEAHDAADDRRQHAARVLDECERQALVGLCEGVAVVARAELARPAHRARAQRRRQPGVGAPPPVRPVQRRRERELLACPCCEGGGACVRRLQHPRGREAIDGRARRPEGRRREEARRDATRVSERAIVDRGWPRHVPAHSEAVGRRAPWGFAAAHREGAHVDVERARCGRAAEQLREARAAPCRHQLPRIPRVAPSQRHRPHRRSRSRHAIRVQDVHAAGAAQAEADDTRAPELHWLRWRRWRLQGGRWRRRGWRRRRRRRRWRWQLGR